MGGQIIEYLEFAGTYLQQFMVFRGFTFMLGVYSIIMGIAIILILIRLAEMKYLVVLATGQSVPITKGRMQKKWEAVKKRLDSDNSNEWKAGILELAGMVNEILGIIGYKGDLLGEKLINIFPGQLSNLEELSVANKVKNQIVQDPNFVISKEDAQKTASTFVETLQFFEVIDKDEENENE